MKDRIEYCIDLIGDVETKFLKFSKNKYFKDVIKKNIVLFYSIRRPESSDPPPKLQS